MAGKTVYEDGLELLGKLEIGTVQSKHQRDVEVSCGVVQSEQNLKILNVLCDVLHGEGDSLVELTTVLRNGMKESGEDSTLTFEQVRDAVDVVRKNDVDLKRDAFRAALLKVAAPFYCDDFGRDIFVGEWENGVPSDVRLALGADDIEAGERAVRVELLSDPRFHALKRLELHGNDVVDALGENDENMEFAAITESVEEFMLNEADLSGEMMDSVQQMQLPNLKRLVIEGPHLVTAEGVGILAGNPYLGGVKELELFCGPQNAVSGEHVLDYIDNFARLGESGLMHRLKKLELKEFHELFERHPKLSVNQVWRNFFTMWPAVPNKSGFVSQGSVEEVIIELNGITDLNVFAILTLARNLKSLKVLELMTTHPEVVFDWLKKARFTTSLERLDLSGAFDDDVHPQGLKPYEEEIRKLFPNLKELKV